jgi:multidrug resistance efflux pump
MVAGCAPAASAEPRPAAPLEVPGRTRCLLSRRGIIAAAIMRPVVEVLVSPGDRVTKGQVLIKLFDLEPQARIRARERDLKSLEARAQFSQRNLELAEPARSTGALPENRYNEIRATALSNEALVRAAEAELALAQGELKLYNVTAAIDGEVAWLDVSPGTVTWPGSMIWGEIVDVRELDVRCELTPLQADQIVVGQSADVWLDGKAEVLATGKVAVIGKAAERQSGLVPVLVRVANPQEHLRVDIAVKVRFPTERRR